MVTGILHFLKNARSKLINNLISPYIRQQSPLSFPSINFTLRSLKNDVWDPALLYKMFDIFPMKILTIENCIKPFNNHKIILHKFSDCTISLGRLGTHPLENFFGYLRSLCRANDIIDNMIRQICKACILKEIDSELHIWMNINKRLIFG